MVAPKKAHSITIPIDLDQVVAPALLLWAWRDYLPLQPGPFLSATGKAPAA